MQLSHTRPVASATFDKPYRVSAAGLVPLMGPPANAGLCELGDERMSVPTDKGANAGSKFSSLVAGMAAGADSVDDMALLRHGGMGKVFDRGYAPSTLGSFLRTVHLWPRPPVRCRGLAVLAQPGENTQLLGADQDSGPVTVDKTTPSSRSTVSRSRVRHSGTPACETLKLHLPTNWPWQTMWLALDNAVFRKRVSAT